MPAWESWAPPRRARSLARSLFDTNFFGVIRLTNEVLPHMRRRGSGRIINISSAAPQGSYSRATADHGLRSIADTRQRYVILAAQTGVRRRCQMGSPRSVSGDLGTPYGVPDRGCQR